MIDREHALPVTRQCQILAIARSSVYAVPQPIAAGDLAVMRQLDELHLQHPFAGSRMLRDLLRLQGVRVGRKHVAGITLVGVGTGSITGVASRSTLMSWSEDSSAGLWSSGDW